MSFRHRLLEEIAAAASKRDAEDVIDAYHAELSTMAPAEKERLLDQVADLFAERFDELPE
jgi:hypothetical protein